jgi:hypothetical protein
MDDSAEAASLLTQELQEWPTGPGPSLSHLRTRNMSTLRAHFRYERPPNERGWIH